MHDQSHRHLYPDSTEEETSPPNLPRDRDRRTINGRRSSFRDSNATYANTAGVFKETDDDEPPSRETEEEVEGKEGSEEKQEPQNPDLRLSIIATSKSQRAQPDSVDEGFIKPDAEGMSEPGTSTCDEEMERVNGYTDDESYRPSVEEVVEDTDEECVDCREGLLPESKGDEPPDLDLDPEPVFVPGIDRDIDRAVFYRYEVWVSRQPEIERSQ